MQTVNLNLIPGAVLPVVNVSQYDEGRQYALSIYEGTASYDLSGKTVIIQGTKGDNKGVAYDESARVNGSPVISKSGNTVTIRTPLQMTAAAGKAVMELKITDGSGNDVHTLNFILDVEKAALSDDTDISDSELAPYIDGAQEAARQAAASATSAAGSASQAAASASNASSSASSASSSASTATTKAGEAEASATAASQAATRAEGASLHPPYIGANGNWYVWNTSSGQYVDSGVDASITITIGQTTTLPAGSNASVTNSGTSTDPVLNFGIPQGPKGDKGDKGESGYGVYIKDHGLILVGSAEVVNHGLVLG